MFWTHFYDLITKAVSLLAAILLMLELPIFEGKHGVIFFFSMLALAIVIFFAVLRTIGSWLYCRLKLEMDISPMEARLLNPALSPIGIATTWLPLRELEEVDREARYQTALQIQRSWIESKKVERKEQMDRFAQKRTKTKVLTVALIVYAIASLVLFQFNLPPASYVVEAYCRLFETDSYYPIVLWIMLLLPIVVVVKLVDRDVE